MTKRPREPGWSTGTVLVVDHDQSVRTTTRHLLESQDYRVLDAGDSVAAERIAKLYVGPIHVLLIDVDVSGASGLALADRLRSLRPELRMLFTSRQAQRELVKNGQLAAASPFIRKPFNADELALKLRSVLRATS
jgi:two-component system, cell cycle sensor histidine kinase and response regulator CckA